jgi:hypothetical protein
MEARVITLFHTNFPAILYGGSFTITAIKEFVSLLSKLKSYEVWHSGDGVSGVSQRILRGINAIQQRVGFLANQLTSDPVIIWLSSGLTGASVNFVQRMVSFIDSMYIEYKASSFFTEQQLCELCVGYLEQIFEGLRSARCLIQDASETDTAILL